MADRRFFTASGPFTLGQLAEIAGAELTPGADADQRFHDVAPLDRAGPRDVSFLDNKLYVDAFAASAAGACVARADFVERAPRGMALLLTTRPYRAFAMIAQAFYPPEAQAPGIAGEARIDTTAAVGPDCRIEPGVVIGAGAEIGAGCTIGANSVIGRGVVIGKETRIGAGASLSYCLVGARCLIHPGVRIGQRGFGFAMDAEGHVDVPQLGRVIIGDDVEIGANSCVDRGAGPDTVIGDGCRIDNLVQIGHNVVLGRGCVIVAQVGISGSTVLEDHVIIGGQGGLAGHLRIGKGARIAAQTGVLRDVAAGTTVMGTPAVPITQHFREVATLSRLAKKRGK